MGNKSLYDIVRSRQVLYGSWRKVRENGLRSLSKDTREKTKAFDVDSHRHIRRIEDQLRNKKFKFSAQVGIVVRKSGKKPRPLVVSPISNRIVQRAILDVLQLQSFVKAVMDIPTSYGGIQGKSCRFAISAVCKAIKDGARFFIRSDVQSFFTKIPKSVVLDFFRNSTKDESFLSVLKEAIDVDLANAEGLGEDKYLFPFDDEGVAQGSPLSPLLGNILLSDFDREMNDRGIICIRYIDDFILLGAPDKVKKAFASAQRKLACFGMRAYDPVSEDAKAEMGHVEKGFDFLGCQIEPGMVQPSKNARKKMISGITEIVKNGKLCIGKIAKDGLANRNIAGYAHTIAEIDLVVQGWGHAFIFCNVRKVFEDLDVLIDLNVHELGAYYRKVCGSESSTIRRRALGVRLLTDVPQIIIPHIS